MMWAIKRPLCALALWCHHISGCCYLILQIPQESPWGLRLVQQLAGLEQVPPQCASLDGAPQQPRLGPCESVCRTPTIDGFFIMSSKCCFKVTSILLTIRPAPDPTVHHVLLYPRPGVHLTHSLTWKIQITLSKWRRFRSSNNSPAQWWWYSQLSLSGSQQRMVLPLFIPLLGRTLTMSDNILVTTAEKWVLLASSAV